MVDAKSVGISVVSALMAGLLVLGAVKLSDTNAYYCESSKTVMQCDKLTTYYGLDNGKCVNPSVGNKLCRTGWLRITSEVEVGSASAMQYLCGFNGCVPKE